MKKKIISLIIIAALSVCSLPGCAADSHKSTNSETSSSISTTLSDASSDNVIYKANVPADLDFEGHTFVISNNYSEIDLWNQKDIVAEELNGEVINDAVYNRNSNIEELYNCKIESMNSKDEGPSNMIKKFVNSGDSGIDFGTMVLNEFPVLAQQSMLAELNSINSIDLTSPWYDQNSVKELSVLNKLFGIVSDLSIGDEKATTAMVFNKQLYEDMNFKNEYGDIYDMVKSGKWDFDTFKKMAGSVSSDLNGDSKIDENDRYGLLYQRDSLTAMFNAFGFKIASKDKDDLPKMTLMESGGPDAIDKLLEFFYTHETCFHVMKFFESTDTTFDIGMSNMFANNQGLFMWIRLADVENLRQIDIDFGIIPQPKYNTEQNDYISSVNPYVGVAVCIPQTAYDFEKVGMFIEIMSAESKNMLIPAYYDKALYGKGTRDQESSEMLDIIFANRVYDIGQIYDIGGISNYLIYMTMKDLNNYASKYDKSKKMIERKLNNIIENFSNIE